MEKSPVCVSGWLVGYKKCGAVFVCIGKEVVLACEIRPGVEG